MIENIEAFEMFMSIRFHSEKKDSVYFLEWLDAFSADLEVAKMDIFSLKLYIEILKFQNRVYRRCQQ